MRGIIIRERGDELVIRPSDAEVQRFGQGASVQVAETQPEAEVDWADVGRHRYLYDRFGRRIAVIDELLVDHEWVDATAFGDAASRFLRGRTRVRLTARGVSLREVGQ